MQLISSWSGGKDSCYALMKAIEEGAKAQVLLNVLNEGGKISRSHGIPVAILNAQAKAMRVPLHTVKATWGNYEQNFIKTLKELKSKYQTDTAVFGDIDIKTHRDWEEKVCQHSGLNALLPLWQGDRKQLVKEMITSGIQAIIVSCNTTLGTSFLGKEITLETLEELEAKGVDCCGENGEYHTLVINCPLFTTPIKLPNYNTIQYENYCFIVWEDNIF